MKVSVNDLRRYANTFLKVCKKITNLEEELGSKYKIPHTNEFISVEETPSNAGTYGYAISYNLPGVGIPLELKLNPILGYTNIILKADEIIEQYKPAAEDRFGNIIQMKKLLSDKLSDGLKEIERLTRS